MELIKNTDVTPIHMLIEYRSNDQKLRANEFNAINYNTTLIHFSIKTLSPGFKPVQTV